MEKLLAVGVRLVATVSPLGYGPMANAACRAEVLVLGLPEAKEVTAWLLGDA